MYVYMWVKYAFKVKDKYVETKHHNSLESFFSSSGQKPKNSRTHIHLIIYKDEWKPQTITIEQQQPQKQHYQTKRQRKKSEIESEWMNEWSKKHKTMRRSAWERKLHESMMQKENERIANRKIITIEIEREKKMLDTHMGTHCRLDQRLLDAALPKSKGKFGKWKAGHENTHTFMYAKLKRQIWKNSRCMNECRRRHRQQQR